MATNQSNLQVAELETSLGVNEPTLAEYILAKHDAARGDAAEFRRVMTAEAGVEEVVADRLHALISTLTVCSEPLARLSCISAKSRCA